MQEINIKITTENKKDFDIETHVHVNMSLPQLTACMYEILKQLEEMNEPAYVLASLKLAEEIH